MATANGGDGGVRPRARESEGETGESEREQGGIGTAAGVVHAARGRRQAGGGRAAARARARSSFGAWGGRRRGATVLGWAGQLAGLNREEPR